MPTVIDANAVAVTEQDDNLQVRFADEAVVTRDTLTVQRLRLTRPGDAATTMEVVSIKHIQEDGTVFVSTGSLLLKRNRLLVSFDPVTAAQAGKKRNLVARFRLESDRFQELKKALKQICKGLNCFVDDSATGFALLKAIVLGPPTPTSERLVVPTYCAVCGAVAMGVFLASDGAGPLKMIFGVLGGLGLGVLVGFLKGLHFRTMFRYK
jgi:hypothetical protein